MGQIEYFSFHFSPPPPHPSQACSVGEVGFDFDWKENSKKGRERVPVWK
jgi:Tat protein secretion system quality control protein TatD with DNase activity